MHAHALQYLLPYALKPRARILDIGSGSGYLVHILASLALQHGASADSTNSNSPESSTNNGTNARASNDTPNPSITNAPTDPANTVTHAATNMPAASKPLVVGIEHIRALRNLGESNMRKSPSGRRLLDEGIAKFVYGDGRKGWSEDAPYDVIHVGAAATCVHDELLRQLKAPGRMFIPVEDVDGWGSQSVWCVDKDERGSVKREKLFGVMYVPLTDSPERGS